jgi:hypothetical protein
VLMEHHADGGLTSPDKAASAADGRRAFRCPAVCARCIRSSTSLLETEKNAASLLG